jgi:FkbM family methyltransferase
VSRLGRLATRAGSVLPDPLFYRGIAAIYRVGYERHLLSLRQLIPEGSTAVDVGAWWGPWTYWLSRRAASVWSFEPNPELAAFLGRVVSPSVHVENVALSDHRGTGTLFAPRGVGRDALATLSAAHRESEARPMEVPLRRLDDYGLQQVQFMKIDVEGHELAVLEGAAGTISESAPIVLVEIDQAFHDPPIEEIFEWLLARRYEGKFKRHGSWTPLAHFDVQRDQPTDRDALSPGYVNNFLFTPLRD